jgi:membrane protein DedA with SNARE-associated domain
VMDWVQGLPLLPAIGFLYVVIWARAGGTYLLGRGARRAANRGRVKKLLESPAVQRATVLVNRWGAWVVALSFLTVGFQTAANAAAGLTGMPAKRYLPALAVGGLAWAVIYATVGLVAVAGWLELFLVSPAGAVAVLALLVLLVALVLRHRRRAGVRETVVDALAEGAAEPAPQTASADESAAADGTAADDGTATADPASTGTGRSAQTSAD